jgi:hypothetical protein
MAKAIQKLDQMLEIIFKYGRHKPKIKAKTKGKKKKGS